jgi:hypothetical protein
MEFLLGYTEHEYVAVDGRGHVNLNGTIVDRAGDGNRLHFTLALDQTHLRAALCQLDGITAKFPVR